MYRLFNKLIKVRVVALIVSFIVLSLIHSALVLPMLVTTFPLVLGSASWSATVGSAEGVLGFMQETSTFATAMKWIWGVLITNSLAEAALAGIIGGVVADRLIKYLKLNNTPFKVEA